MLAANQEIVEPSIPSKERLQGLLACSVTKLDTNTLIAIARMGRSPRNIIVFPRAKAKRCADRWHVTSASRAGLGNYSLNG